MGVRRQDYRNGTWKRAKNTIMTEMMMIILRNITTSMSAESARAAKQNVTPTHVAERSQPSGSHHFRFRFGNQPLLLVQSVPARIISGFVCSTLVSIQLLGTGNWGDTNWRVRARAR